VVLVGPRQSGKSTLARQFLPADHPNYFDLEDPRSRLSLAEPMTALEVLQGLVVIDEVQHAPELFQVLRVLIDRDDRPGQYLLLGSASPALLRQTSETLLGRVEVIEITGLDLREVGTGHASRLWLRGGFPPAYTAGSDADVVLERAHHHAGQVGARGVGGLEGGDVVVGELDQMRAVFGGHAGR
jgi:predicted AAA+ superfamily ATPase